MPSRPSLSGAEGIIARLRAEGYESYLVGGSVRDILRGVEPEDYDIVTQATPAQVEALFPRTIPVGVSFGVVLVVEGSHPYEVATFRAEADYEDGRHPSSVRFATAREDVLRRDFTVNGLLLDPASGEIADYVGGRQDLEGRVVRAIGDPEKRFAEDHLRMLRAVRLAAGLNYALDPAAAGAISENAPKILQISAERIRQELAKILTQGGARRGFELLEETGLLKQILPEASALKGVLQPSLYHPEGDVWEHTLRMLALLAPAPETGTIDEGIAWGALFHDLGKGSCRFEDHRGIHFYRHATVGQELARGIMKRLKFSGAMTERILALIGCHLHFIHVRQMREARLKRFLRMPDFASHLELHRLDCLGSHGLLENYNYCREKKGGFAREDLHPPKLLDGRDLIELGFDPGPLFKTILKAVENAQLSSLVKTGEEARAFVIARFSPPDGLR